MIMLPITARATDIQPFTLIFSLYIIKGRIAERKIHPPVTMGYCIDASTLRRAISKRKFPSPLHIPSATDQGIAFKNGLICILSRFLIATIVNKIKPTIEPRNRFTIENDCGVTDKPRPKTS